MPEDAARLEASLEDTFGTPFDLWQWRGGWQEVRGRTRGRTQNTRLSADLRDCLDRLRSGDGQPRVFQTDPAGHALGIPLPEKGDHFYAVFRFEDGSPNLWLRLAEQFLHARAKDAEMAALQLENREYAVQLTHDLEELVFLRCLADHLEFRGSSSDLESLADAVLPQLRHAVTAELLGLVLEAGPSNSHDAEPPAVFWSGKRVIDDAQCLQLVEQYREQALDQPLVVNRDSADSPGASSGFILLPVTASHRRFGWLLAVNRIQTDVDIEKAPWRLSHQEFGSAEATLLESAASVLAAHMTTTGLFREKEKLLINVVRAIVSALDARDEYTRGHSERVARFGKRLAREIGYSKDARERVYLTCLLHDVGKIGIRDATLQKAGRLTDEEFNDIKRHPDLGWSILHDLTQLQHLFPGIVHHHERYDGGGYPDGLAGEAIPLDARLVAIVDAYDAMTSDRPYRAGLSQEKTEAILRAGKGTQWDPEMVDAFLRIMPDILKIKQAYQRPAPAKRRQHSVTGANDGDEGQGDEGADRTGQAVSPVAEKSAQPS
jgi:HD-GYP domain-containing protein (c-di-GMP phosphodiesterase class II)